MTERQHLLTGDDLARPAKHLPLKVIRELGRKLHRQLLTSGNWETLAEDLGYGFEDIHQFSSLAAMRQESTPGETMLLDWIQRGNGCTLFVLRSALIKADRQDCVEYLEQEVYDKVICMDLLVCIKDESTRETEHTSIRTRSDLCLIDSLRHRLQQPITDNYVLQDRNASWVNTMAREFKGRELMLLKRASDVPMEQDPTVDSSNPSLGANFTNTADDTEYTDSAYVYQRTPGANREHSLTQNTTNDLDFVQQLRESQNCPLNIQQENNTHSNTFRQVELPPAMHGNNVTQFSDESNGNYPWTASDSSLLNDPTRIPSETLDCSNNDSEYNDPSALVCSLDLGKDKFLHRKELNGIPLANYQGQLMKANELKNSSLTKQKEIDIGDEFTEDSAEYEDPSMFRPELGMDETEEYNYAVDVSQERDDSLTELKKVIQSEMSSDKSPFQSDDTLLKMSDSTQLINSGIVSDVNFADDTIYNDDNNSTYPDWDSVCPDRNHERGDNSATLWREHGSTNQVSDLHHAANTSVNFFLDRHESSESFNDMEDSNYIDSDERGIGPDQGDFERDVGTSSPMTNRQGVSQTHEGAYIDFNKYPQTTADNSPSIQRLCTRRNAYRGDMGSTRDRLSSHERVQGTVTSIPGEHHRLSSHQRVQSTVTSIPREHHNDTLKRVRFGGRCVSTVETQHGHYDTLDRQTSCPNFEYSSSPSTRVSNSRVSNSTDFSTLAEVFSPTMRSAGLEYMSRDSHDKNTYVTESLVSRSSDSDRLLHGKRNSFPGTDSGSTMFKDKFKFARHSLPVTRHRQDDTGSHVSRPLPSLPGDHVTVDPDQPPSLHRQSSQVSTQSGGIPGDRYKTVIGGKSSRPMLDHSLANDNLFMHYNTELRGYKCWSPKETEYTIHKTMCDVQNEDGLYVFWYNRSKKNLIITVTENGELLHFRVRTKVVDKHLYYMVTHSRIFPDVQQLLQYHNDNGLYVDKDRIVLMRLPVCVKYDRIPVSV